MTPVDRAATRTAAPVPGPRAAAARAAVVAQLEADDAVLAAWEGGSAAFGRADETSDLDVCVVCRDGAVASVIDGMEAALRRVQPDLHVWDHPDGIFGAQRFWQPAGDPQHATITMVDTVVWNADADRDTYLEFLMPERHGHALELLDRDGTLARARADAAFDPAAHRERIVRELARIRARHALLRGFGPKELGRGRTLDAHMVHNSMVVAPLVALLGMAHRPLRFDFQLRYLHDELPEDVVECLVPIVEPGLDRLEAAIAEAVEWIDELLREVDPHALPIEEHAAAMRDAFGRRQSLVALKQERRRR